MESSVQNWLSEQCSAIPGVRNALVLVGTRAGQPFPAAVWPVASRSPTEVYTTARDTLLAKLPIQRVSPSANSQNRVFSLTIGLGERAVGALALAVDPRETPSDQFVLGKLQPAIAKLQPIVAALQAASPGSSEALRLSATILAHAGFEQACTAFANEVGNLFRCHRVSIGLARKSSIRVAAVSHGSGAIGNSEAFAEIEAAMEEAMDQASPVLYPPAKNAPARIVLAHAALAKSTPGSILTVPLVVGDEVVGAITLEGPAEAGFNDDEQALLEHLIALLAPLLILKKRAEESAWQRSRSEMARLWGQFRAPGVNRVKLVAGGLAAVLLLMTAVPVPHRVTAPARVEGEVQRVLASPGDGFLQQVYARPGDEVRQDQPLVELAQQDLLLEERKWQSEMAQHEKAFGGAMSKGDRTQLAVSMARMHEAQAQLSLVQQHLARSSLVAPFDGIVTEGELAQSLGSPVKKGQVLMTVAPRGRYRIVVEVDESDIAHVHPGQEGSLAPTARPGDGQAFVVSRITPVATTIETRNVFEVEGRIEERRAAAADSESLRPGMKGVAKIQVGYRSLGWIFLHRPVNWLRLNFWRWGA